MIAALAFVALLGLLSVFQIALAAGAPWGRFAWGGQHPGVLPAGYRIGSAVSLLVYSFIALLALDRAGLLSLFPPGFSQVGMWVAFGLLVLGVLMNAISRSKHERYTATPVALVLAVLALLIAQGPPATPGGPVSVAEKVERGFPDALSEQQLAELPEFQSAVVWLDEPETFALITWGSSSCPGVVTALTVTASDAIQLQLAAPDEGPCTADLAATSHTFSMPAESSARPVTVTLVSPAVERQVLTLH